MHLHLLAKQVQQIEGQANVFCIAMKVENQLVSAFFVRQEQAGNVLSVWLGPLADALLLDQGRTAQVLLHLLLVAYLLCQSLDLADFVFFGFVRGEVLALKGLSVLSIPEVGFVQ